MEYSLVKKGKDICETINQLIDEDKKFIINKSKLYCKYCLRLGKDKVNSITNNFYEECEDYLKELEGNSNNGLEIEQNEKDFINSYLSILAREGKEICKEFESKYNVDNELIIQKSYTYCRFIASHFFSEKDPELYERCLNYMDKVHDFNRYESTFNAIKSEKKKTKLI